MCVLHLREGDSVRVVGQRRVKWGRWCDLPKPYVIRKVQARFQLPKARSTYSYPKLNLGSILHLSDNDRRGQSEGVFWFLRWRPPTSICFNLGSARLVMMTKKKITLSIIISMRNKNLMKNFLPSYIHWCGYRENPQEVFCQQTSNQNFREEHL